MSKHPRDDIYEGDNLKHPSPKRAKEIDADPPLAELDELLSKQKTERPVRNVLHWFRSKDLRQQDNIGLHHASLKVKEGNGALIALYLFSPKDLEWHGTSAARTDFILENIRVLKHELQKKHIPLALVTAKKRKEVTTAVADFVEKHDISHIFGNYEYEVDELRRDIKLVSQFAEAKSDVSLQLFHDQTVMEPGLLKTGTGGPMKVFTPYHKKWVSIVSEDPGLLDTFAEPEANDKSSIKDLSELFETEIPALPETKPFGSKDDEARIRKLWPAGNEAGMKRLLKFLNNKVADYAAHRSEPGRDPSSRMSAYFSTGVVSVRQALNEARKHNKNKSFDGSGDAGIAAWVREIVFREFYRQTLVTTPHQSMNLPQNLKFDNVEWEDDREGWEKWCKGTTGVPFVDAGMRQLNTEAYMHNRARMNTASYLRANLLIDYRKGERYFLERLVDADIINNNSGWQPSYTVFNPVVQAEKCDPNGDYIRR